MDPDTNQNQGVRRCHYLCLYALLSKTKYIGGYSHVLMAHKTYLIKLVPSGSHSNVANSTQGQMAWQWSKLKVCLNAGALPGFGFCRGLGGQELTCWFWSVFNLESSFFFSRHRSFIW